LFCSPGEAVRALSEVIKFMTLASESVEQRLTPSGRVDVAWHEFILFTQSYASFCDEHFGKFIHHEPSSDKALNSKRYADTLKQYRIRFGEPAAEYWGADHSSRKDLAAAHCGNCESDS
jgi:hypothetical protein